MQRLKMQLQDLSKQIAPTVGVDLQSRIAQIDAELKGMESELLAKSQGYLLAKGKYDSVVNLLGQLKDKEHNEAFIASRESYRLSTEVDKARRRLRMLQEKIDGLCEIDSSTIESQTTLDAIASQLSTKRNIYLEMKNAWDDLVSGFDSYAGRFFDSTNAYEFLEMLRAYEVTEILRLATSADSQAEQVLDELFQSVMQYDPDIKTTEHLDGTMKQFQNRVERARNTINDINLMGHLAEPISYIMKENGVLSTEFYTTLEESIQQLQERQEQLIRSISLLHQQRDTISTDLDEELLERTKKEIAAMQLKLDRTNKEIITLPKKDRESITSLEEIASRVDAPNRLVLLYIPEGSEKLLTLTKDLEKELGGLREKEANLRSDIEKLKRDRQIIDDILKSDEANRLNARMSKIDLFMTILITLDEVLDNCKDLRNGKEIQKQLDVLWKYDVDKAFYQLINDMFLERCEHYFEMVDENTFHKERIYQFSYLDQWFKYDDKQQRIDGLSGGTASVMTVLSLGSRTPKTRFGTILLVDEFQDVAETLRGETYGELRRKDNLSFGFFVRPRENTPLTLRPIEK
jgi:hypothetical protein